MTAENAATAAEDVVLIQWPRIVELSKPLKLLHELWHV
jgi:hypothetical protein